MCETTILDQIKQHHQEENTASEEVFEFLYRCAMVDAISMKSFKGKKKWVYNVQEAKKCVKVYVDKLFAQDSFKSQEEHDTLFLEIAHKICDAINQNKDREDDFTFGNAQKLLNMTAKHCCIYTYMNPSLWDIFKFCHCPMDGRMLENAWEKYNERDFNIILKDKEKENLRTKGTFCRPWGTENFENTEIFLHAIWHLQKSFESGRKTKNVFRWNWIFIFGISSKKKRNKSFRIQKQPPHCRGCFYLERFFSVRFAYDWQNA